ncbi:MAG: hypothetical protein ACYC5M_05300 [Anaerolineae bacterium]
MLKLWNRYMPLMRLAGAALLLLVLGTVVYQLYDFYVDKLGVTPTKTITAYFDSMARGDYDEVYRLTAKADLTDIYGRPITQGEFRSQLREMTGGSTLPFRSVEVTKLSDAKGSRFYLVKLHADVGGTSGVSRMVVEVRREGKLWVVTYPFAIML